MSALPPGPTVSGLVRRSAGPSALQRAGELQPQQRTGGELPVHRTQGQRRAIGVKVRVPHRPFQIEPLGTSQATPDGSSGRTQLTGSRASNINANANAASAISR